MVEKTENRINIEKIIKKFIKQRKEKFYNGDITKYLYDESKGSVYPDTTSIRRVINEYIKKGVIVRKKEGSRVVFYPVIKNDSSINILPPIHTTNSDVDLVEIEACVKNMRSNMEKIRINISSLNTQYSDLPSKIVRDLSNVIGTQILKKMKEELGEFFQGFVKDFNILKDEHLKRSKQLGVIIGSMNNLKGNVNTSKKKRVYGNPYK